MTRIEVGVFGLSAPFLVASARSLFRDRDLEVAFTRVGSSDEQFRDFGAGRYHLLQTAFDNVASYHLNGGNAVGRPLDVQALFALDAGMNLTVMGAPGIDRIDQLRGKVVSVDAVTTGFAYVLFGLLEQAGLVSGDYEVAGHGGVATRLQALLEGKADATLLSNGLEIVGAHKGLKQLATSRELLDPYLGSVLAVSASWYAGNQDVAQRFRSAYEEALAFCLDGANRLEVVRVISEARDVPGDQADEIFRAELGELGIAKKTDIDPVAALNVLRLRARHKGFEIEQRLDSLIGPGSALIV